MKKYFIIMIKGYQMLISPLSRGKCRFIPTCSNYAIEAIERHGVIRGMFLSAGRILRCNPFSPGGYDPVPEKKEKL
ncbi:MAG TPA: membrane protein insertion efficiency factor YidD [Bacillota bacterium]|nr:membrane protein insertion efficiency factor YidD [Bacillota bacterium]HPL53256.1 membrane protein insertion efficiency factor YidD [Bacillota bacterium]